MFSRFSIGQLRRSILFAVIVLAGHAARTLHAQAVVVASPNGRNTIVLSEREPGVCFEVARDGRTLVGPSLLGPHLAKHGSIGETSRIIKQQRDEIDEQSTLYWGKTDKLVERCSLALVELESKERFQWQVELRAYDDGVAFRYRLADSGDGGTPKPVAIENEVTRFDLRGDPIALYNVLDGFKTSHEAPYRRTQIAAMQAGELMDCPLVLDWKQGPAAAITEARLRGFAGMYLQRPNGNANAVRCVLSPHPKRQDVAVIGSLPLESPWRVMLLADSAGELVESNLLLSLNDAPASDFAWARPGKTTFHWWYGEFEDDHKLADPRQVFVARHRKYIDFCAANDIAYHSVSGDGYAWYQQSKTAGYGVAQPDADTRVARPELGLPEVFAYARERGVGIRLWVHWKALEANLEETLAIYETWGVRGLMVDFLDRDDQEMIAYTERLLDAAAKHKIHIQLHGSAKYSGEHRTYPHLFNREGVLNLEYSKWSKLCTPAHSVNVAFSRALVGPVDYHHGGIRCATQDDFVARDRAPLVMGTRCHQLALYIVYENPMPMLADAPHVYAKADGFDFLRIVPTTWDETRFLAGELGEYIVIARRKGDTWYLGGITNWTSREILLPTRFLGPGNYVLRSWTDDSAAGADPNTVKSTDGVRLTVDGQLEVNIASGGGFVAILQK